MKVIPQLEECGSFTLLQIMSSVHLLSKGRNGSSSGSCLEQSRGRKSKRKKKTKEK